jgi:protein-tyrosine phosphatase
MHGQMERHLRLVGTRNLRDIGGYATRDGGQTRWRTVFRSDCLDQLTAAAQAELLGLGVRTVIDLRDASELEERPNVFATSRHLTYRWVPFWDAPLPPGMVPDLSRGYIRELDLRGSAIVSVCRVLLQNEGLPALIHCAAGKDRTGVTIGMLLALAGVPDEQIAQDFALSATCLGEEFLEEARGYASSNGLVWEEVEDLWGAPPERMIATLEHLARRWGGAEAYLRQHGLTAEEVGALRDRLVER